jgi:hypothetical protein
VTTAPPPVYSVFQLHSAEQQLLSPGEGLPPLARLNYSMIAARKGAPICYSVSGIERQVPDADRFHALQEEHSGKTAAGDLVLNVSSRVIHSDRGQLVG